MLEADLERHHALDKINAYRARVKAPALELDLAMRDFAYAGSVELSKDHVPPQTRHRRRQPVLGRPGGPERLANRRLAECEERKRHHRSDPGGHDGGALPAAAQP